MRGDGRTSARPRARIFVADDDDALRWTVASALRQQGHEVSELADGGRLLVALARCLRHGGGGPPDLIVSDVRMPVMTGLALAMAARELEAHVPLILMTAFPDRELLRRADRLGAHVLAKPFDLARLEDLVGRCLRGARGTLVAT